MAQVEASGTAEVNWNLDHEVVVIGVGRIAPSAIIQGNDA